MKKLFLIVSILLFISTLDAAVSKRYKRPLIDVEPRMTFYTDFEDTEFGFGCDMIFNPLPNFGLRLELTEINIDGGTVFFLNHGFFNLLPKLDAFIYLPARNIQPYVHAGFGLIAGEGATLLSVGGGIGIDYFLNRSAALSLEPGLYILSTSNGASHTDVLLRITMGVKLGIIR